MTNEPRETVHQRTGGLIDLKLACGAQSGPFSKNDSKVTCSDCKAAPKAKR